MSAVDSVGNVSSQSVAASATTKALSDTQAPSTPTNLKAAATSSSQINLSWTASSDNVGVTGYRVYRNGIQIATATTTAYSSTGLAPSTSYTYKVAAVDSANNVSSQSVSALATTATSSATSTTKYSITVKVTAADGTTPISAARIYLRRDDVPITTGYSNISGVWVFSSLNPGIYTFEVYKSGVDFGNGIGKIGTAVSADIRTGNVARLIKALP